jgi:hypothetical protein
MDAKLIRPISCATTLIFFLTQAAHPQTAAPPPAPPPAAATASAPAAAPAGEPETAVFKKEQIDQLLAPIALYPDDLVVMVLMAATYPTEIVQADRWARKPENAKLKGDQLAAELDKQTWDPSVKSLVPFPQVLQMMSEQLDWTQKLGDAMLAQEKDVMEGVQRLRKSAESAGTLQSTQQQTVKNEGDTIIIQPSDPQTVYVPAYNPQTAYGTWPYPSYPPPYYPPPPAYYPGYPYGGALLTGLAFGVGIGIIANNWGWGNANWNGGSINIDNSRYNNINRNNINAGRAAQRPAGSGNWQHDPSHRGGTAYRDRGSQQKFQRASTRPAGGRQDFNGRNNGVGNNNGIGNGGRNNGVGNGGRNNGVGNGGANRPGGGANRAATRPAGGANRPSAGAGAGIGARPAARPSAPAFSGMNNGGAARAQSARGNASRGSIGGARGGGAGARSGGAARGGGGAARAGGGGASRGGGGGAARGGGGGARGGGRR